MKKFNGMHPADFIRNHALCEAIQWQGDNYDNVYTWVMKWDLADPGISDLDGHLEVTNRYGSAILKEGDWLVRDILNELFYRSSDAAFEGVYEAA